MGLEVRELNPRGKNVVLGERFGAWRVFGSYRRDLGLEGDGNPSNDSAGIWENGALQQEEGTGVCGRLPYPIHDPLHPCRGLGAPQRPQVSLQEINREQGRGSFSEEIQAHHATNKRSHCQGCTPAGGGQGVWGTRVTTLVTPSPLQPQDLAIVNRHGLISSLLTRSGSWRWMPGWWAASTGTICSYWTNHPPDPPCPPQC